MGFRPFKKYAWSDISRAQLEKTFQEIDGLDNDYVLRSSQTELEEHFEDAVSVNAIVLHVDAKYIRNQQGIKVDVSHDFLRGFEDGERAFVPGTLIEIAIPFEGDKPLWDVRASTYSLSGHPKIEISGNEIVISFHFPDDAADQQRLKRDIDQAVDGLANAVANLANDVEKHNASTPGRVKERIEHKRLKALKAVSTVSGLGIPMQRTTTPPVYAIPAKRRPRPVSTPKPSTEIYTPEPILLEDDYQYILNVIRSMAKVMERSPQAFAGQDEESIRQQFLVPLNGHYPATAETFNANGKTDILIRENDRNVFIAECKFWTGPKGFNEAIEQLLGYLTWRDCKCALLMFNRNKDAASVAEKMHNEMVQRNEHRKTVSHSPEGDCRYVFIKDDEPGKDIHITTMLFNVPS